MIRPSSVPIRSCMGCGERAPQAELLCVTTSPAGALQLVEQRRRTGRTGYLHDRLGCWERFAARKGPLRSLRRNVDKQARMMVLQGLKAAESAGSMR